MTPPCPVPSRWVLDELAWELALTAAERELRLARGALAHAGCWDAVGGEVLDRYIAALEARNALRDGRP